MGGESTDPRATDRGGLTHPLKGPQAWAWFMLLLSTLTCYYFIYIILMIVSFVMVHVLAIANTYVTILFYV